MPEHPTYTAIHAVILAYLQRFQDDPEDTDLEQLTRDILDRIYSAIAGMPYHVVGSRVGPSASTWSTDVLPREPVLTLLGFDHCDA